MLEVTERAIEEIAQMREQGGLGPDRGIGIMPQVDGSLRLAPVQPGPTDQVIERAGEPVVVVPGVLADQLDGLVLDCRDAPGGPQFTLTGPETGGLGAPAGVGPDYHD